MGRGTVYMKIKRNPEVCRHPEGWMVDPLSALVEADGRIIASELHDTEALLRLVLEQQRRMLSQQKVTSHQRLTCCM